MGSPIESWEGAGAYFTGAHNFTSELMLIIAIGATIGAIVIGFITEEVAYASHKK